MTTHCLQQCPAGSGGEHDERLFEEVEQHFCDLCGLEFKAEELTEGFCSECNEIDKDC